MSEPARIDLSTYFVTDAALSGERGVVEIVRAAVAGGVTAVQLREKDASTRELFELTVRVSEVTAGRAALLINDRVDVYLAARAAGVTPVILGDAIEGEAREVALVHAALARQAAARHFIVGERALSLPALLLSGGETTVTVRGAGRGGRNAEFLLALGVALDGAPGLHALACDTDGIDGTEENAGAFYGPETMAKAAAHSIDLKARLADNDAWSAFNAMGDLIVTGPTLTNVNDFRAILVTGKRIA